ncbi:class I SAM-dependent methyltransferase [Pleurocapsales cyanobacterium LEGE 06147]|nr:class I SAM-dependent methyltransferase [Pleurocapsales cyanobacterium LEGE 06147]
MTNCTVPPPIQRWLYRVFDRLPLHLHLDFWGQTTLDFNQDNLPTIALQIYHPGVLKTLFLSQDPLALVDAYLQGYIEVKGDLAPVIPIIQQHSYAKINWMQSLRAWLTACTLPSLPNLQRSNAPWKKLQFQTRRERDRVAVQHHYDTGNAFYKLWLDPQMVYSCAYFEHPQMNLQEAQEAKLERICRKLKLSPGDRLLDIGCGWGALMRWAVTRYGVKSHGITLSKEQYAYNQSWIAEAGLSDQIPVELLDYRDLPKEPTYDKIVSIGMVEHVGVQNYPIYFQSVLAALKPNGLFLNHGITTRDRWQNTSLGERFIDRYIFPDGRLTRLSTRLDAAEAAGWEIVDVDNWRPHYAKTLRCWVENFEAAFEQITAQIGERRAQLWRIYLIGCALGFENNQMGIYQTLLHRKTDAVWNLPMTRANWLW